MTELPPSIAAAVRESFARQALMTTLGARLTLVEAGHVAIEMAYDPRLTQQQGLFHGGVVGALGDSAGGYAALTAMAAGSDVVTVEYKINFMRGAVGPLLRAEGRVVRSGRTLTVARVDVMCGEPGALEPCAVLQATFLRIAGGG